MNNKENLSDFEIIRRTQSKFIYDIFYFEKDSNNSFKTNITKLLKTKFKNNEHAQKYKDYIIAMQTMYEFLYNNNYFKKYCKGFEAHNGYIEFVLNIEKMLKQNPNLAKDLKQYFNEKFDDKAYKYNFVVENYIECPIENAPWISTNNVIGGRTWLS